jgi:hypothetical protein
MKVNLKEIQKRIDRRYINVQKHPVILFAMLDNKNYNQIIWQLIKPKGNSTFKVGELSD